MKGKRLITDIDVDDRLLYQLTNLIKNVDNSIHYANTSYFDYQFIRSLQDEPSLKSIMFGQHEYVVPYLFGGMQYQAREVPL